MSVIYYIISNRSLPNFVRPQRRVTNYLRLASNSSKNQQYFYTKQFWTLTTNFKPFAVGILQNDVILHYFSAVLCENFRPVALPMLYDKWVNKSENSFWDKVNNFKINFIGQQVQKYRNIQLVFIFCNVVFVSGSTSNV